MNSIPSIRTQELFYQNSLLPYRNVRYLAENHLEIFIQSSAIFFTNRRYDTTEIQTSCSHNLLALSIFFSGAQRAKEVMRRLFYQCNQFLSIDLGGIKKKFCINNLFTGPCLSRINEKMHEDEKTEQAILKEDCQNHPIMQNLIGNVECLEKKYSEIDSMAIDENQASLDLYNLSQTIFYDFNQWTLISLETDIDLYRDKISETHSVIYYIAIMNPRNKCSHVFAIEQFFNPFEKTDYYRLYQSFINQMTLLEFFKKRGYQEGCEGCMTRFELWQFLDDLKLILEPTHDEKTRLQAFQKCFAVETLGLPNFFFDAETQTLSGYSLRYQVNEFNPEECLFNLLNFLNFLSEKI